MSQTAVNDGASAKSPLAAVITALTVVITLLYETSRQPVEIIDTVPLDGAEHQVVPPGMLVLRPRSDIQIFGSRDVTRFPTTGAAVTAFLDKQDLDL